MNSSSSWNGEVTVGDRCLVLRLGSPHAVLSWAVLNGGRRTASEVVWCEVPGDKTPEGPQRLLAQRLDEGGLPRDAGGSRVMVWAPIAGRHRCLAPSPSGRAVA
jgi:hypothetical protein